ncbi:MAG: nitrogenase iron-molybdenum cofactor biosynthesis protein NifN [Methylocystaceae bacterium]|nr:nitrogenase iron-molybdenum cofactor biosynthesis protein NifN [Methylocystaceae bacterium]
MAEIIKRKKALSVSPLKSSSTIGAALAFMGVSRTIPMLHGSQGCSAFGKVFFVRHFREPIPLQTTAMDQVSAVMGSYENVVEGVKTICENSAPHMVGVPTTGLSETQGVDINMAVKEFRKKYPEYDHIPVVPVNTPDYSGCLETGFAQAVLAMLKTLVKPRKAAVRKKQVTVLAGSHLTPGDIEEIKDIVEMFGLRPVVFPDLSTALDGHLPEFDFSPLSVGGTPVDEILSINASAATLVVGRSLTEAADWLQEETGIVDYRFDHLFGLQAVDELIMALREISGKEVPEKLERQRAQLQDAMLDTHFMLGMSRLAFAGDPDLIYGMSKFLETIGGETCVAVSPINADILKEIPTDFVKIGDLEDLEVLSADKNLDVIISNSHAVDTAARLGVPILRCGFPQWDLIGGYQKTWVGYRGGRQVLFDLANLQLENHKGEVKPYKSIYGQKPEYTKGQDNGTTEKVDHHGYCH